MKDVSITIGIIGRQGSGKDEVAKYLQARYGLEHMKFADTLKDIVRELGLEPEDRDLKEVPQPVALQLDPNPRNYPKLYQAFGNQFEEAMGLLHENLSLWKHTDNGEYVVYVVSPRKLQQIVGTEVGRELDPDVWVTATADYAPRRVVFSDVRFLNEAMSCDILLYVDRPGVEPDLSHSSEKLTEIVHNLTRDYFRGKIIMLNEPEEFFILRALNDRDLTVVYNTQGLEELGNKVDRALSRTRHRELFGDKDA